LGEAHGAPWGSRFGNTGTTRRRDQGSGQHGAIVKESTPTGCPTLGCAHLILLLRRHVRQWQNDVTAALPSKCAAPLVVI
jgi:hypothetical protein